MVNRSGRHDAPALAQMGSAGLDRRRFAALLLAATAGAATVGQPRAATSDTDGPDVRTIDFDWTDPTRGRSVPALLYWPAMRGGRVPLIVFSHGLGGSRQGYRYLGEAWSARGYASLHVQHTGSDAALWRGDPLQLVARLTHAARTEEALDRARDVSFAMDRILEPKGGFAAAIDPGRIVVAGHSYGANTVLVLSGAKVMRGGRTLAAPDRRIRAGIAISAPAFTGESDLRPVLAGIAVPTLHITATCDVINLPGYRSDADDRLAIFEAVGHPDKLMAVFEGGSHSVFTDRALTGGPFLNPRIKAATAELGLAFLDLALHADRAPLSTWQAAWQPILAAPPRLAPTAFATPSTSWLRPRPALLPAG